LSKICKDLGTVDELDSSCASFAAKKFSTILTAFSLSAKFNLFPLASTNSWTRGLPSALFGGLRIFSSWLIPASEELFMYKPFPSFFKKNNSVLNHWLAADALSAIPENSVFFEMLSYKLVKIWCLEARIRSAKTVSPESIASL